MNTKDRLGAYSMAKTDHKLSWSEIRELFRYTERRCYELEFIFLFMKDYPGVTFDELQTILKASKSLKNYHVELCNRPATASDHHMAKLDKETVNTIAKKYGMDVEMENVDPRGYVVKFNMPSGARNEWGGLLGVPAE